METPDPASTPRLIDSDVHNYIDLAEMTPYLSAYWCEEIKRGNRPTSGAPHSSPIGVLRSDAVPPGGGTPGSDPAHLMEHHMNAHGIEYALLTGSGILGLSIQPNTDFGNAAMSAYNDVLAEKWLQFSPRYLGSLVINHSDPQASVREIERMGNHPGIKQIIMASGANRLFGQRFYHPIYEAAEAFGLPVAVHPGTEGAGNAGAPTPAGYTSRYMEWHNILPINYMAHINSLVCEGVFEKYPRLKFVAIEGGIAWLPHLMWRMDKNYKALRSTTPWLKRLPSEYIREHIYLTTQPIEEPDRPADLGTLIEMIGMQDRILFSSDYPHWDFDNPKVALSPIPKDWRGKVMVDNAAALYNLGTAPKGQP